MIKDFYNLEKAPEKNPFAPQDFHTDLFGMEKPFWSFIRKTM